MQTRPQDSAYKQGRPHQRQTNGMVLGEWLATELAATIRGNKPATILTLVDTPFQATLSLWRQYGEEMLADTIINYITMHYSPVRETILFFRPDTLHNCLMNTRHRVFLQRLGYPVEKGLRTCLGMLQCRFQNCCPHEVGILLGIPFKDVCGFMGMVDLPLTCRGDWCVYGDLDESMALMKQFAADRALVSRLLSRGTPPDQVFSAQFASGHQSA